MSNVSKKAVVTYLKKHTYEQTAERFDLSVGKIFSIEINPDQSTSR